MPTQRYVYIVCEDQDKQILKKFYDRWQKIKSPGMEVFIRLDETRSYSPAVVLCTDREAALHHQARIKLLSWEEFA